MLCKATGFLMPVLHPCSCHLNSMLPTASCCGADDWGQYADYADLCCWRHSAFHPEQKPGRIINAIQTLRATTVYVPPTLLYMMMAEDHLTTLTICLRHLIIGGAAMRPDMVAAMPRFNHALETRFGQTEVPQMLLHGA